METNFSFENVPKVYYHNLFSIIQEIINNGLKYGRDKTRWNVLQEKNELLFLMVAKSEYEKFQGRTNE